MKILLATDGSNYSRAAARFLACFDLSESDEITILHAVNRVAAPHDEDLYSSALREISAELAPRILSAALKDLGNVKAMINTVIAEGPPRERIVDAASGVDMVVAGARGLKGIRSIFIGSVTRSVFIDSPKPVLIVKPPAAETGEIKRVLLAVDCSEQSRRAEAFLSSMPLSAGAEITALHVVLPFFINVPEIFASEIKGRFAGTEKAEAVRVCRSRDLLGEAKEQLRKKFDRVGTLSVVGDPSTEIIKTAAELKADLIVTGCRGLRGVKRMLGSVSKNILVHSSCSVLTCKG